MIEGESGRYDFAITVAGDVGVVLDVFDSSKRDNDEAYVESAQHASVDEAKSAAEAYARETES
jgi:hypothetical protein